MPIESMNVDHFLERICNTDRTGENNAPNLVFFLGAGCSISSGIQGAAGLVRMWWDSMGPTQKQKVPGYSDLCAGEYYNQVVEAKFGANTKERQEDFARIMRDVRPGFGYIALATLIHQSTQWSCRDERQSPIVLTTNFDDLLERAFLIYTPVVPVVVSHDSLVRYSTSSRCIIKLHGDYRFQPYTDDTSTRSLSPVVSERIATEIKDRAIVFIGYGGNDHGIASFIKKCIESNNISNVYWVNKNEPGKIMADSFKDVTAYHISSVTFDDLMARMIDFTNIRHPSTCRLMGHIDNYHEYFFQNLMQGTTASATASRLSQKFQDWFRVVQKAIDCARNRNPAKAQHIMERGMQQFRHISSYRMYYAHLLFDYRIDLDKANFHYRWAIRLDPGNGRAKANYAPFLIQNNNYIKDMNPEQLLLEAIKIDSVDMNSIVNLSGYLFSIGRDRDAKNWLHRARRYPLSDINCLEADFYELAHLYEIGKGNALLRRIGKNLKNGIRPHNYLYKDNASVARGENPKDHPLGDLISDLASILEGTLNVTHLESHPHFHWIVT